MKLKNRILVASGLFIWASTSMFLVWYTKYEIFGVIGCLTLAALNIYYKNQSNRSAL